MSLSMPDRATARRALQHHVERGIQAQAAELGLKELDALDAAWKRNEEEGGGPIRLADLQREYALMALGMPNAVSRLEDEEWYP